MTVTQPIAKLSLRRSLAQSLAMCPVFEPARTDEAEFGSAFHAFAAMYILRCLAVGEETRIEDVEELAREAFFVAPRGLDMSYLDLLRDLGDRFARSHTFHAAETLGVERTFLAETEHFNLNGTVDLVSLVEGTAERPIGIRITDWKTQYPVEPHSTQLRSYSAYACVQMPTVRYVETAADHVRYSGAGIVEEVYDRETLLAFLADFDYGLHRILSGPPTPMGGRACQYCAKKGSCPAALEPWRSVPASMEQAADAVQQLIRMEEAVELHRAAVRKYFAGAAVMVVGGEEIGYLTPREPRFTVTQPLRAARALLRNHVDGIALLEMDAAHVPPGARGQLIDEGLAVLEYGKPRFGRRKATETALATTTEEQP
jgi:PD-(D/E)XK nuclease superfamily